MKFVSEFLFKKGTRLSGAYVDSADLVSVLPLRRLYIVSRLNLELANRIVSHSHRRWKIVGLFALTRAVDLLYIHPAGNRMRGLSEPRGFGPRFPDESSMEEHIDYLLR